MRAKDIRVPKGKLPGLRGRKSRADGKRRVPKVPINPLKDALSEKEFKKPRIRSADAAPTLTDPPDFLNVDGVYMWNLIGSAVAKVGELTTDHLPGLVALSYSHQRMRAKMKQGLDISANELNAYNRMLSGYGLTPLSGHILDRAGNRRKKPFVELPPEDSPGDSFSSLITAAHK